MAEGCGTDVIVLYDIAVCLRLRFSPSAVLTDESAQRHLVDRNVGLLCNSTVQKGENSFVHTYCRLASLNRHDVAAKNTEITLH